jgi:hypothetical protein
MAQIKLIGQTEMVDQIREDSDTQLTIINQISSKLVELNQTSLSLSQISGKIKELLELELDVIS